MPPSPRGDGVDHRGEPVPHVVGNVVSELLRSGGQAPDEAVARALRRPPRGSVAQAHRRDKWCKNVRLRNWSKTAPSLPAESRGRRAAAKRRQISSTTPGSRWLG